MKIKKCILLFVAFVMCISSLNLHCFAKEEVKADVLYSLGIFDESNIAPEKNITRQEAARYIMGLLKETDAKPKDTIYEDVKIDNKYSGFISSALARGVISEALNFRPEDKITGSEFIKMLVSALGYDFLATLEGGYPDGYIFAAQKTGLLDGVVLSQNEPVSIKQATILFQNALNAPVLTETVTADKDGNISFSYENSKKQETYLYNKLGVSAFNVYVEDIDLKEKNAAVTILSTRSNKENSDFVSGKTYKLQINEKATISDIAHANATMWLSEENEILCFSLASDTSVKYAYIDEINKVHKMGVTSEIREIENVLLYGEEDYLDISEDCRFYFDGEKIDKGARAYMGAFARVVIADDEIISLEGFKMNEGGIVTSVDNGLITYKNGKWDDKIYNSHAESDELSVIINGEKSNYWGIIPEMLFDYSEYDGKVLLVVSTRTVTDIFEGKTENSIILGGDYIDLSEEWEVYCSYDGLSYKKDVKKDDLLGELVTAHLDLAGKVRFMSKPIENEENSEFYGFILGYDEDLFQEDAKVKIFRLYSDHAEEKILSVTKTVKNTKEFEKMKNAALMLTGDDLNESIKANNDIVWRMREVNGKIVSLKEAELFDQNPENGITTVTYIPGGTTPYISSPRIFFDGAQICALYFDEYLGRVTAKILTHEDIRDKTFSNVRIDFYNEPGSSDICLALFRGDVKTIATNRADLINIGVMKVMGITEGKEMSHALDIKILNDASYKVPLGSVSDNSTYFYVKYAKNAAIADESPINIVETVSLDGSPYSWKVNDNLNQDGSLNSADGLYTDVVTRSDGRRIFFETQDSKQTDPNSKDARYYLNVLSDYYVYRLTDNPNNRFEQVTVNEIEPGMRVWYGLRNSTISFVIIK